MQISDSEDENVLSKVQKTELGEKVRLLEEENRSLKVALRNLTDMPKALEMSQELILALKSAATVLTTLQDKSTPIKKVPINATQLIATAATPLRSSSVPISEACYSTASEKDDVSWILLKIDGLFEIYRRADIKIGK